MHSHGLPAEEGASIPEGDMVGKPKEKDPRTKETIIVRGDHRFYDVTPLGDGEPPLEIIASPAGEQSTTLAVSHIPTSPKKVDLDNHPSYGDGYGDSASLNNSTQNRGNTMSDSDSKDNASLQAKLRQARVAQGNERIEFGVERDSAIRTGDHTLAGPPIEYKPVDPELFAAESKIFSPKKGDWRDQKAAENDQKQRGGGGKGL